MLQSGGGGCVCETKTGICKRKEKIHEFAGVILSGEQKKTKFLKRFGGTLKQKVYRTFLSLA